MDFLLIRLHQPVRSLGHPIPDLDILKLSFVAPLLKKYLFLLKLILYESARIFCCTENPPKTGHDDFLLQ